MASLFALHFALKKATVKKKKKKKNFTTQHGCVYRVLIFKTSAQVFNFIKRYCSFENFFSCTDYFYDANASLSMPLEQKRVVFFFSCDEK